ncbi:hypothetical protein RclHR1_15600011 [Rhizophagus clarus]|uniref:Uncharacterized protein n=1 Tax=Rhizophagus clarus TaxID=94130 RepID=A0A2Z6QT44_9GLOM|nr:hypothetical protein RclHR1_15600011 [Rhizophagus clarus]
MSSELELLRQRITELEAENAEIPDLRRKLSEFDAERVDLRRKLSVSDAEIAELKSRNAEFLRSNAEYNERRDAENAKLKARIEEMESEFGDRIKKVEQKQTLQSALTANDNSSNNSSPSFNSVAVPEAIIVPTNSAKHLNGKPLEEKDMDSFLLEAHKKIVSSEIKQCNKEKKNEKNGQGLIQEISLSVPKDNHVTKISKTAQSRKSDNSDALVSSFHGTSMIEISQHLAQLCDKALIAEEHRLEANQEEILCWYHYGINFVFQLEALCDKNKIGEKKARGLIYDEVVKQVNILRLDKIQYIKSYSANKISKFTNDEIQKIMDHFSNKPSTDFSEDRDNFINDDSSSQTDASEVRVNPLVSAEVSKSTAPIPLTHDSNSSDDSKEVSPNNSLKDVNDYYKMILEECEKDFASQSGEESNESKSDNENDSSDSKEGMPDDSDDDGYDGYGGYNEYGERDRGYYYRDGEYERKTSPMMSPIISMVTA